MKSNCELCDRVKELSFHHLIPRTLHSNKYYKKTYVSSYLKNTGLDLCKDCHKTVHEFFTEKELGKSYNTKEKLLSSEKLRNYIVWIKKQN